MHTKTVTTSANGTVTETDGATTYHQVDLDATGPLYLFDNAIDVACWGGALVVDLLVTIEKEEWFEGEGEVQNGGYTYTTKNGGVSPTKIISKSHADYVPIGDFLAAAGALGSGLNSVIGKTSLGSDLADKFSKIIDLAKKIASLPDDVKKEMARGQMPKPVGRHAATVTIHCVEKCPFNNKSYSVADTTKMGQEIHTSYEGKGLGVVRDNHGSVDVEKK